MTKSYLKFLRQEFYFDPWRQRMIIPNTQDIEVVVFEIDKEHRGNIASTAYPVLAWSISENLDEIKPVIVVKLQDKLWCYTLHGSCIFPDGVTVPDIHAALKYVLGHSQTKAHAKGN
jgi:hypothetical protein